MSSAVASDLLHLLSSKTRSNLMARSHIRSAARGELERLDFLEVDTPVLGERVEEYPAGHFRVSQASGPDLWLVQSPQIFKQALIASGVERYFQFAHCFRDNDREPGRTDYLREFIQLDVEMVARTVDEVIAVAEKVVTSITDELDVELPPVPFPRIDYRAAMERYGSDRPDLRAHGQIASCVWVTDFPLGYTSASGSIMLERHPMALPHSLPRSAQGLLDTRSHSFDLVINGYEIASGDLRISDRSLQADLLELAALDPRDFDDLLTVLEDCPPHGGFGLGIDRICMQLLDAKSVAEVSAFPDGFGA